MNILLILIAVILAELVILKIRSIVLFDKDVFQLFSRSKDISQKTFHYSQLAGLPPPVQRYFLHVLKEGQPYISYVRLLHKGRFRTSLKKDWATLKGKNIFPPKILDLSGKVPPHPSPPSTSLLLEKDN